MKVSLSASSPQSVRFSLALLYPSKSGTSMGTCPSPSLVEAHGGFEDFCAHSPFCTVCDLSVVCLSAGDLNAKPSRSDEVAAHMVYGVHAGTYRPPLELLLLLMTTNRKKNDMRSGCPQMPTPRHVGHGEKVSTHGTVLDPAAANAAWPDSPSAKAGR